MREYTKVYLDHLRSDENIVKIAEIIEEVKKASVLGWDGDHFSNAATCEILRALYAFDPDLRCLNSKPSVQID